MGTGSMGSTESNGGTTRRRLLQTAGTCLPALSLPTGAGSAQSNGGSDGGELRWQTDIARYVDSSPTVIDGTVYVGSNHGDVFAVDAETGDVRWRFETPGAANTTPTVVDGVVYVATHRSGLDLGDRGEYVHALDATSGIERWRVQIGTLGGMFASPTVAEGTVYVGADGAVLALDASDGTERWRIGTGTAMLSSPTVLGGTVYVGAEDVLALDAADGTEQWRVETTDDIHSSPTVADDTVYVGADGAVLALDASDGTERWRFETENSVESSPTVTENTVYVGSHDSRVYALDASEGVERWRFETDGPVNSSPTVADGTVYVGSGESTFGAGPEDTDTNLYALDASEGVERWRFETDGPIVSSPTVVDGTVYVGSFDGDLYAVNADDAGTSSGTRVDLGTLGHHDEWRYAGTTVDIPVFSISGWRLAFVLTAGATGLLGIGSAVAPGVDTDRWSRISFNVGLLVLIVGVALSTVTAVLLAPLGEYPLWQRSATPSIHRAVVSGSSTEIALVAVLFFGTLLFAAGFVIDRSRFDSAQRERRLSGHAPPVEDVPSSAFPAIANGLFVVLVLDLALLVVFGIDIFVPWLLVALLPAMHTAAYAIHRYRCFERSGVAAGDMADRREQSGPFSTRVEHGPEGERVVHTSDSATGTSNSAASGHTDDSDSLPDSTAKASGAHESRDDPSADGEPTDGEQTDDIPTPNEIVDDRLEALGEALQTARSARDAGEYDRALDACNKAIEAGEHALEVARDDASARVDEVRSRIDDARARCEAIETERDDRATAADRLDAIEAELDRISGELGDDPSEVAADPDAHLEDLESLRSTFESAATAISGHDLPGLESREERLGNRYTELRDRAKRMAEVAISIPEAIPATPRRSLSHDDVKKQELIGSGGNANVYRAVAPTDGGDLTVAVKEPQLSGTLHTSDAERILDEAETWQQLDGHDHVVSVVDYGEEPLPWIAMEFMDAGHLGERAGDLPLQQALWTAFAVTQAVRHAHRHGVAHLDLKPENVLFRTVEGAWDVPKVADWGLSKHLLEHSNSVEGLTVQYAAPEQFDPDAHGSPDTVTDIYQLGAIFYELFTGNPPFEGTDFEVIEKIRSEDPRPPSELVDIPAEVDDILATAMATEKSDRYEDVLYLRDDLRELLALDPK